MATRHAAPTPRLDTREQHLRIGSPVPGLELFLRYVPPSGSGAARASAGVGPGETTARTVLYVHGGTFPSALSIAHRFDGRSWRDELVEAGFHVYGLDFHGFGGSDPYPEMDEPAERHPPLGQADVASEQIERAARFIVGRHRVPRLSIIAHSWGTIAAGRFAGRCPELVDRLVFFGPISQRAKRAEPIRYPAWRLVSLEDQWIRFTADVPRGAASVLSRGHFDDWGERYLDTDGESRTRRPPSVKTPSGPWQDIALAAAGALGYQPELVRAPVAIVRGEWDGLVTDADARWLFDRLTSARSKRDIKIGRATHLMHLEENRYALYREARGFLTGGDTPEREEP